jgi:MoaA/NifB/PqqE/SkfB family radical SAM enzyme
MTTTCFHPWVGLDITPQGEFKPCCKYNNVIANNLVDYLASTELANLKFEFDQGSQPAACQRCWDDEASGLPSKRQLDNQYLFNNQTPNLDSLKVLSLPFGNSCNLACRICSSYSSSGWITESKKLQEHVPDIKIYKHQRFYQDQNFIDQIKAICNNVIHVEFPGGEPFLAGVDEHLDFLDFLVTLDVANISLHYITNATIFPKQEFWDRWAKFKNVDIQLSIDGIGPQFEYNRWPAKWSEVNTNIQHYILQRDLCDNLQISVSHSVSIFTVYYLPEFVKWCLQNKLGKPYLGLVTDPSMYSIRSLPTNVKDQISEKISRFKFENIVLYMYREDISNQLNYQFIKLLDQQRGESFEKTFPEFYQLLKESECRP